MYAFQLPSVIPAAGSAGGPPLPKDYRLFANQAFSGDLRLVFLNCIHDPKQLQPTWDYFTAQAQRQASGSKAK
jgi:hypothetical protein